MDEQDRIAGQGPVDNHEPPRDEPHVEGDAVPIPSRIRDAVSDMRHRLRDEGSRDVIQEYEQRYHGTGRLEAPPNTSANEPPIYGSPMHGSKSKRMFDPVEVGDNERKWATLAHGSTLLTALLGIPSGGLMVLITMFAPLLIYFAFRKRSEYVAFHALQAFTIQLVGTIGALVIITVGSLIALTLLLVSVPLLLVFLLGLVLMILTVIAWVLLIAVALAMPLGMVIYSVIAMFETWNGKNYRIPYIARWVESQMYSG